MLKPATHSYFDRIQRWGLSVCCCVFQRLFGICRFGMDKQRVARVGTAAEARMHARYVALSISNISGAVNQKPTLRAHKSCFTRECK